MQPRTLRGFLGKKALIIGDVGAGKTKLTIGLLEEAVQRSFGNDITIIDMAPATTIVGGRKVGGRLSELTLISKSVRYWAPERVETPRLSAKSAADLHRLVKLNRERIEPILARFLAEPSLILFINDISIFLQSGEVDPVLSAARAARTFIANGYYGSYLASDHGAGVSKVEKELMDKLADQMDIVIRL